MVFAVGRSWADLGKGERGAVFLGKDERGVAEAYAWSATGLAMLESGSLSGAWSHAHASLLGCVADGRSQGRMKALAWASAGSRLVMGLLALGLALQLGWRWLLGLGLATGLGPNKNKIIIKKVKI